MLDYLVVASFGILVGLSELLSAYRDRPMLALRTPGAGLYLAVNAAASVAALALIRQFDWTFGLKEDGQIEVVQLLAAGFGAMAFLRSAVFIVRVGDQNVPIGPGFFLTSLADFAQYGVTNAVQHEVTQARAQLAHLAAEGWKFDDASRELPVYCLALAPQPVSEAEQAHLAVNIERLRDDATGLPDEVKTLLLGLELQKLVGEEIFALAVRRIGEMMGRASERPHQSDPLADAVQGLVDQQSESIPRADPGSPPEAPGGGRGHDPSRSGRSDVG